MIVDVRGGLGTQVLELLGCYALAIEGKRSITGVRVNCGGGAWDGGPVSNVLVDYVSQIFSGLPEVEMTLGNNKLGIFKQQSILSLILRHRLSILQLIGPLNRYDGMRHIPIMHVRTGNRCMVEMQTYIDYAQSHKVYLIGNVPDDIAMVSGNNISFSPVQDWFAAFYASEIIATASSFIISLLFIDPNLKVSMWQKQSGQAFDEVYGPVMRKYEHLFPNFRWIK